MPEISLAVTKAVLDYAKPPRERERQIAYTSPTPDIAPRLAEVTGKRRLKLRFAGRITLVVADRGAIWRAHNDEYADNFDAVFTFLGRYPSHQCGFFASSRSELAPQVMRTFRNSRDPRYRGQL